jgi:hypothetical protein
MKYAGRSLVPGLGFVILVTTGAVDASAQSQPRDPVLIPGPIRPTGEGAPSRDAAPRPTVGTAAIRGRVVDGVTGEPIVRARVRVSGGMAMVAPLLTDGEGRFSFSKLPAGGYSVSVEKPPYESTSHPAAGRTLRSRVYQPLMLRDGEARDGVTVPLFRGGVVTGHVFDAHGDPVERASVQLIYLSRSERPTARNAVQTNDLGEFRIAHVQPGRYLIRVQPQTRQVFDRTGRPAEPLPEPMPTYFPAALSMNEAQAIDIKRGQTVSGLDMTLSDGIPTLITGTVVRSDGQPIANGFLNARLDGAEAFGRFMGPGFNGSGIRQDGQFQIQLPPGEYVLMATVQSPGGNNQQNNEQMGSAKVVANGGVLEGVSIVVGRPATATGRVIFEGMSPPLPPSSQTGLPLNSRDGDCRSGQVTVNKDWSFKAEGLYGAGCLAPANVFGRWQVKAVMFRGENLLDRGVAFEPGQEYSDVQVIVTDKRTQMALAVTDDSGEPTREYAALAFPVDKSRWTQLDRYMRTAVPPPLSALSPPSIASVAGPSTNGEPNPALSRTPGRILNLPPGEYYVIAIDDIDAEASREPAVLERLAQNATRVQLTDDAPIEIPLRVIKLADVIR